MTATPSTGNEAALGAKPPHSRRGGILGFLQTFRRQRLGMVGAVMISLTVIAAIGAPLIAPFDPNKIDPFRVLEAPGADHWFGTDSLGRDVFSRVLFGSRVSLYAGILVVSVSMMIGTVIGLVAGYFGGLIDAILMRTMDALLAFPGLVFALAVTAALGPSLTNAMIAIAVLSFPGAARVVRGETLSLRERDFVTAGRVLGASSSRILFRHILPNAMAPIIVIASLRIGGAILIETGLSFLGLGVQPPTASWGSMVNEGSRFLERAPWISMTSGGAIFLAVLGANLMGDAIRDTLDPRLRNE